MTAIKKTLVTITSTYPASRDDRGEQLAEHSTQLMAALMVSALRYMCIFFEAE